MGYLFDAVAVATEIREFQGFPIPLIDFCLSNLASRGEVTFDSHQGVDVFGVTTPEESAVHGDHPRSLDLAAPATVPFKKRLFIKPVPREFTQEKVQTELEEYLKGMVRVILHFDPIDMARNRGFAFIDFESDELADAAFKKVSAGGLALSGHICTCDWATPDNNPSDEVMSKVKIVFARYVPLETTEEFMSSYFGKYGAVEKVKKNRDFWFVHYVERESAVKAIKGLNGAKIGNNVIEVMLAKPINPAFREQHFQMKRQFGYRDPPQQQRFQPRYDNYDRGGARPFDRLPRPFERDTPMAGGVGGRGGFSRPFNNAPTFRDSRPSGPLAPPATPGRGSMSKFKLCDFFLRGSCNKGSACTFAHGENELVRTQPGLSPSPRPYSSPSGHHDSYSPRDRGDGNYGGGYNRGGPNPYGRVERYDRPDDRYERDDRGMDFRGGDRYGGDRYDGGGGNRYGDQYGGGGGDRYGGGGGDRYGGGGGNQGFQPRGDHAGGGYKRTYDDMSTPSKPYDGYQGTPTRVLPPPQRFGGAPMPSPSSRPRPVVPLPQESPYSGGGGQDGYRDSGYGGYDRSYSDPQQGYPGTPVAAPHSTYLQGGPTPTTGYQPPQQQYQQQYQQQQQQQHGGHYPQTPVRPHPGQYGYPPY